MPELPDEGEIEDRQIQIQAEIVSDFRSKLGINQDAFADRYGVSAEEISALEAGDADLESLYEIVLEDCLETCPGEILIGPGMPCQNCGAPMKSFERGDSAGLKCPVCHQGGIAWTNPDGPMHDQTRYDVRLDTSKFDRKKAIVTIALIDGFDIHSARDLVDQNLCFEKQVSAAEVFRLHRKMEALGFSLIIEPEFRWSLSEGE